MQAARLAHLSILKPASLGSASAACSCCAADPLPLPLPLPVCFAAVRLAYLASSCARKLFASAAPLFLHMQVAKSQPAASKLLHSDAHIPPHTQLGGAMLCPARARPSLNCLVECLGNQPWGIPLLSMIRCHMFLGTSRHVHAYWSF